MKEIDLDRDYNNEPAQGPDVLDRIIDFEAGELGVGGIIALFVDLLNTGLAWKLQGSYGRTAEALVSNGLIEKRKDGTYAAAEIDFQGDGDE